MIGSLADMRVIVIDYIANLIVIDDYFRHRRTERHFIGAGRKNLPQKTICPEINFSRSKWL